MCLNLKHVLSHGLAKKQEIDLGKKQTMFLKKISLSWWIMQFLEKEHGKSEKTQRYQTCKNWKRRDYFVSEQNTKLWYTKILF